MIFEGVKSLLSKSKEIQIKRYSSNELKVTVTESYCVQRQSVLLKFYYYV